MLNSIVEIKADDRRLVVAFTPPLTDEMREELNEILAGPNTVEEVFAVLKGLSEDWERLVQTPAVYPRWHLN